MRDAIAVAPARRYASRRRGRGARRWRTRAMPSSKAILARKPRSRAAASGEATTWRTSPRRYSPVTLGVANAPPPPNEAAASARGHLADGVRGAAGHVVGAQRPRRNAPAGRGQGQDVAVGHVADVHEVAALAAVFEDPGRHAVLQRGAEDRGHSRVRRVARHPGAVHVVVAQRDGRAAGHPRPVGRQVLLGQLARRVGVTRVQRRRPRRTVAEDSCDPQAGQRGSNTPASRSAAARGSGRTGPCSGHSYAALAVDDHRGGQHQPRHALPRHRGEQDRRPGHVDVGCTAEGHRPTRRGRPWPPGGRRRPRRRGRRPRRRSHGRPRRGGRCRLGCRRAFRCARRARASRGRAPRCRPPPWPPGHGIR